MGSLIYRVKLMRQFVDRTGKALTAWEEASAAFLTRVGLISEAESIVALFQLIEQMQQDYLESAFSYTNVLPAGWRCKFRIKSIKLLHTEVMGA